MKRIGWLIGLFLVLFGAFGAPAMAQLSWDSKAFMGIDEILPGMTGYGKTVFKGTKVETFNVEVIGVLRKINFGFDMILIKVTSGPLVDKKLQSVSGMSGSPIYIDDRLVGAYAYAWDFQQEPIAGVTPIAAMLECAQPGSSTPTVVGTLVPRQGVLEIGDKLITRVAVAANKTDAEQVRAKSDATTMVLSPVASPLFVSGMSDSAIKPLQKALGKYNLLAQPGPGKMNIPAPKLEPGSAVGVSLMEGDANLTAVGTVTYIKGDTVLAFGHPFMGLGKADLPMSVAYVQGIVNSSMASFKLASPISQVGAINSDRAYAVSGSLGKTAATVPVYMSLEDKSRNFTRRYSVDMVHNSDISPILLYTFTLFGGADQLGDLKSAEGTFTASTLISTDKLGDISQNMVYAPQAGATKMPMGEFALLSQSLMLNPYEPVQMKQVFINLAYTPERNIATIERITPDRPIAHPGDVVKLTVKIRPFGKPVETKVVSVKVPEYVAEPAMIIAVLGGTMGTMVKSLISPMPAPDEGVKGLVRWLTDNPSPQSILTAQVMPTPSIAYHGQMLRDLPTPLLDQLRFAQFGGALQREKLSNPSGPNADPSGFSEGDVLPSIYTSSQAIPYVLTGGEAVMISIDTEDKLVLGGPNDLFMSFSIPVLSSSLISENGEEGRHRKGPGSKDDYMSAMTWLTPQQRAGIESIADCLDIKELPTTSLKLPTLRYPSLAGQLPLSAALLRMKQGGVSVNAAPSPSAPPKAPGAGPNIDDDECGPDEADAGGNPDEESPLLTKRRPSWGLAERADFLRGKHLGTGVTYKGLLTMTPMTRTLFETTDMVTTKLVSTSAGVFTAGWDSNKVIKLTADGKGATFFPKNDADAGAAEAVTGLVSVGDQLLLATWPDQRVLLLKSDGSIDRQWQIPAMALDLAVTKDGRRFAGCDNGIVYQLLDGAANSLQIVARVPDKQVSVLAAGNDGSLYIGTAPRGKVYCLSAVGRLSALYEGNGAVSAITTDKVGNVYVGHSPTCEVYRIAAGGNSYPVMNGMGRGNRHIMSMAMLGDDLYVATGPAGGIYRVMKPTSEKPDYVTIFARADQRTGVEESNNTGPESVMVNALAVNAQNELLAAASSPSQVLKIEQRTSGAFLSAVLQTPTVAKWGYLELLSRAAEGQSVMVESRSGSTAIPDATWSDWNAVSVNGHTLASDPATFAQFRVRLAGSSLDSPTLAYLKVYYQPRNQAPKVRLQDPKAGDCWRGKKKISWEANDPDSDDLVYTVFFSKDDGATWSQIGKISDDQPQPNAADSSGKNNAAPKSASGALREQEINFDTITMPDGVYRVKVVATDKYARPTDAMTGEDISERMMVDNTAPAIDVARKATNWEQIRRFKITDGMTPVVGGKFRIDGGEWIALVAEDGLFNTLEETAAMLSPDGPISLDAGVHKVEIQAFDAAGNQASATIEVAIDQKPDKVTDLISLPIGNGNKKDYADLMLNGVN